MSEPVEAWVVATNSGLPVDAYGGEAFAARAAVQQDEKWPHLGPHTVHRMIPASPSVLPGEEEA